MPRLSLPSWRLGLSAALLAPLLFGAGPDYVGCGSGPTVAPTGTPLPLGGLACEADGDCPTSCADVRCIAGECVEVGPMVDADGDGVPPPPCGGDCDDQRPTVASGFTELCDGLDNDCNMLIDDGAPTTDGTFPLNVGEPTSIILPFDDRFLLTAKTRGAIFGVPMSIGGEMGTPIELLRLVSGAAFTRVAGASAADGRVLVVAQVDDRALRYVVVRPTGDSLEVVTGPANLPHDLSDLTALEVIAFNGEWAVGIDGDSEGAVARQRAVWTSLTGAPVIRLTTSLSVPQSFAIATDGTHLVLSDAEDGVHFFLSDGTEVVTFAVPGLSYAQHPLASSDGRVVALTTAPVESTHGLTYIDAVTGMGEAFPLRRPPLGSVSLHSTTTAVYIAWAGVGATVVHALLPDLMTLDRELILEDATGAWVEAVSIAEGMSGTAVGGGTATPGASITIVGACGGA